MEERHLKVKLKEKDPISGKLDVVVGLAYVCECVCVCVCEREREYNSVLP